MSCTVAFKGAAALERGYSGSGFVKRGCMLGASLLLLVFPSDIYMGPLILAS